MISGRLAAVAVLLGVALAAMPLAVPGPDVVLAADRDAAYLEDAIAPGVNRTASGFDTASVVVPAGHSVTFLARTDPAFVGRPVEIWTRSRSGDWTRATTRVVAADGSVRYFARITGWTGFWARMFDAGVAVAASHGRIATTGAATFALEVLPPELPGTNRLAIGGQEYRFLVRVHDMAPSRGPVRITATAPGARVTVLRSSLRRGVVGEVVVVPAAVAQESVQAVTITGTRVGDRPMVVRRTIPMIPGEDTEADQARAHLAPFLAWLAAERPELGVTPATEFDGTSATHLLVVTHYLFVSDEWEIALAWHVMVPPDDWARISLRHRWTEAWPSSAFEISSVAGGTTPIEIEPPPAITR